MDTEELSGIVQANWGIEPTSMERLPGYYDYNFLATSEDGTVIVKVSPSVEKDVLTFQNRVLDHLDEAGLNPSVALEGKVVPHNDSFVRVLQYVPGVEAKDAILQSPDSGIVSAGGSYIAELDIALGNFSGSVVQDPSYIWNPINIPQLRNFLGLVDPEQRPLLESVIDGFEREVIESGVYEQVRQGLIHGDAKYTNIIFDSETSRFGSIDFSDLMTAPYVAELATAMTDVMQWHPESFEASLETMRGYETVMPLTPIEREALPHFIRGRLATLVLEGANLTRDADNPYVSEQAVDAWRTLPSIPSDFLAV